MSCWPMLGRLWWKEVRLGWPMLVMGLLLPPLAYIIDWGTLTRRTVSDPTLAVFLLLAMVVIWAAVLAANARPRQTYAGTHFALHPAVTTGTTLLFNGLIAALIGVHLSWYALTNAAGLTPAVLLAIGVLYVITTYGVSFVVSLLFSSWAGMVAGICWVMWHSQALGILTSPHGGGFSMTWELVSLGIALAGLLVIAIVVLLPARPHLLRQRVVACGLLVVMVGGLWAYDALAKARDRQRNRLTLLPSRVCSSDGTLAVEVMANDPFPHNQELRFVDYPRQRMATRTFDKYILPIGLRGRDEALLLQQRPRERRVRLLRWRLEENTLTPMLTLPARRGALVEVLEESQYGMVNNLGSQFTSVSPDGRYALVALGSPYGNNYSYDLWLLDLRRPGSTLVVPAKALFSQPQIAWADGAALLSDGGTLLRITPATGAITALSMPVLEEESR